MIIVSCNKLFSEVCVQVEKCGRFGENAKNIALRASEKFLGTESAKWDCKTSKAAM